MIIFEILKRVILAVIAFPVFLILLYFEFAACGCLLIFLTHLPTDAASIPATANAWTAMIYNTPIGRLMVVLSMLLAGIGALVFLLSCLSKYLSYHLHGFRKGLTTFIVFGYTFVLAFVVVSWLASVIVGAAVGGNIGANIPPGTAQERQQALNAIPAAVRTYEMQHILGIWGASALVSLLVAWMINSYLVFSERLPWCRLPILERSIKKYVPPPVSPPVSPVSRKVDPKPAIPPTPPNAVKLSHSPVLTPSSVAKPLETKTVRNPVKDTLFGNLPLDQWPPPTGDVTAYPWSVFHEARNHLQAGQVPEAIACWQAIVAAPGLESLHYVQAWYFLRQNGVQPPEEEAKSVYGVVGEQGASGVLTAVFIDGQARVYSDQGQGIVWLHPDASIDPLIETILSAATQLVFKMKQSDPKLALSASSTNSISVLTPSGVYLKTGSPGSFESTPLIKPIADGLGQVLLTLMEKTKKA